jgi:prophage regulatory protein
MSDRNRRATTLDALGSLPSMQLINSSQLAEFFGVTRRAIWKWVAKGRLPKPLRISPKTLRWERGTLVKFIERTIAERVE